MKIISELSGKFSWYGKLVFTAILRLAGEDNRNPGLELSSSSSRVSYLQFWLENTHLGLPIDNSLWYSLLWWLLVAADIYKIYRMTKMTTLAFSTVSRLQLGSEGSCTASRDWSLVMPDYPNFLFLSFFFDKVSISFSWLFLFFCVFDYFSVIHDWLQFQLTRGHSSGWRVWGSSEVNVLHWDRPSPANSPHGGRYVQEERRGYVQRWSPPNFQGATEAFTLRSCVMKPPHTRHSPPIGPASTGTGISQSEEACGGIERFLKWASSSVRSI